MARCRRHPMGWADSRRRAALLVARVLVFRVHNTPHAWRGLRLKPSAAAGIDETGSMDLTLESVLSY